MLTSPSFYDLPFSHNTSVTDRQTDDDNHANSSTVTYVRSAKTNTVPQLLKNDQTTVTKQANSLIL